MVSETKGKAQENKTIEILFKSHNSQDWRLFCLKSFQIKLLNAKNSQNGINCRSQQSHNNRKKD